MALTSHDVSRDHAPADRAAQSTPHGAPQARIEALFDAHYDAIWRTLRRLGVPDGSADDAAQRVFIVAARQLDTIVTGHESRYLYGIAVRVASELRRRDPRRRDVADGPAVLEALADDAPGPEDLLLNHEAMCILDNVLSGMPDDLREVLVLAEIEGLTAPEVGVLLEIPIGTVASRLRRAREAFSASARRTRSRLGLSPKGAQ